MLSLSDALAQVKAQTAPTTDPDISDAEITAILTRQSTTTTWLPNTAYSYGQVVLPVIPMGRTYICVLAGTSDTTAPQWLIAPAFDGPVNPLAGSWWGLGVVPFIENVSATPWFFGLADGTCAWRAHTLFAGELYSVRDATRSAWLLKAQKATNQPALKRLGPLEERPMTYEQCMAQARLYAPLGFM